MMGRVMVVKHGGGVVSLPSSVAKLLVAKGKVAFVEAPPKRRGRPPRVRDEVPVMQESEEDDAELSGDADTVMGSAAEVAQESERGESEPVETAKEPVGLPVTAK